MYLREFSHKIFTLPEVIDFRNSSKSFLIFCTGIDKKIFHSSVEEIDIKLLTHHKFVNHFK